MNVSPSETKTDPDYRLLLELVHQLRSDSVFYLKRNISSCVCTQMRAIFMLILYNLISLEMYANVHSFVASELDVLLYAHLVDFKDDSHSGCRNIL